MKRNRCRYCGVSDPAGLRFERSYLGESNYVCRSTASCVDRIKRFAEKRNLPVPVLAEAAADNRESSRQEIPAHSVEARESTENCNRTGEGSSMADSRGGQKHLDDPTSRCAAGNGAQGDPATAGLSAPTDSGAPMDLPPHATARGISFTNKTMHDLLALGLHDDKEK